MLLIELLGPERGKGPAAKIPGKIRKISRKIGKVPIRIEKLWGWCRWGRRNFPIFFVFFRFSSLFCFFVRFSSFFFRFSSLFFVIFSYSPGTRANDCSLLGKWGISLRPRLHRPRWELPEKWPKKRTSPDREAPPV